MRSVARTAVRVGAALTGLAIMLAATGWLYLLAPRSHAPGPSIHDALPLDELSRHDGAPLVVFLAVWVFAAAFLGLLARLLRADRLRAALLLALGVGVWTYLETAVSILVVRQIAAEDAFRAAATVQAVYVPAALAGLAGALMGSDRRPRHSRAPAILASCVAVAGLLSLFDAFLPEHSRTLLDVLAPGARPLARSLEGPLGFALLAVAPALERRRARAWQLAVAFLSVATVLHVLHSDYGAAPVGLLALALVSRRRDFDAPGDPETTPRVVVRAGLFGVLVFAYGAVAIWATDASADQPFRPARALTDTARSLVGLRLRGASWCSLSVLLIALAGGAWLVHSWLAPWRYRHAQEARTRELTRSLVQTWGLDTLAPFALRADKSYFFSDDERAFLAYRVVAGVAVVSGDPIGAPDAFPPLLDAFIAYARRCDWRIAVLGASEQALPLYRSRGLRALYHGDEAVVDVDTFSLEGRAIRKVRQSVHRLRRCGYHAVVLRAGDVSAELRRELEEIARAWRAGEPERGFAMELDALFRLGDDALFVVGFGPDGSARGVLHFAVVPAAAALSLSSMPRRRDTPNGFNEWLVCETVAWCRHKGYSRISLNFAPFAALLAPEAQLSPAQKLERRALLALKGHFQLDNLLLFNRKFFPCWERRFVVYEHRRDLPRVGLAALAAEAYLPFAKKATP